MSAARTVRRISRPDGSQIMVAEYADDAGNEPTKYRYWITVPITGGSTVAVRTGHRTCKTIDGAVRAAEAWLAENPLTPTTIRERLETLMVALERSGL